MALVVVDDIEFFNHIEFIFVCSIFEILIIVSLFECL